MASRYRTLMKIQSVLWCQFGTWFIVLLISVGNLQAQVQTSGIALRKVKLGVPSLSPTQLPPFVAKELGYYRQEGLDVELILMRAGVSLQALVAGSIDYTGSIGSVVAGSVQGLKVVTMMAYATKPLYDLVVRPEISSYAQLKGKTFGIAAQVGFAVEIPKAMLSRNGLDPKQDVHMILIGATADRLAALRANGIQATLMGPPFNFFAYKEGFRNLGFGGDYYQAVVGGFAASERKLKTEPDEVRRFTRATLRGFLAYRSQKQHAIPIMRKYLNITDSQLAEQIYSYTLRSLSLDGTLSEDLIRATIDAQRLASSVTRPVANDEVFELGVLRETMKDLIAKNLVKQ